LTALMTVASGVMMFGVTKGGRRGGVKLAVWKNTGYLTLRRREQICGKELERFTRGHPFFLVTLEPYHYHIEEAGEGEKEVVRRMINASTRFVRSCNNIGRTGS